ncbi:KpsF/GutQ family sugar-phosphate isomerase [Echinicola vietnamensis]|uniref:KpsF/GutQ family protein n=1 Tax=Echinicola vietnamensis (strain DSM 17526 / LMG 23754 / KMM 6221) TaxID=926556 RepID=L0FT42_ECHVK|nr:KpsF/GutQ family sugar-phosphate isomerase [Echinicola vietnamensis]AGA76462.1 KpsF/GutQ family protein [Echinicola vietnamensis DSM 17526]
MNIIKNIRNSAIKVLQTEAEALQNLIPKIDGDFEACVEEILHSKGRVVITGVGKSAIVATKIVATLNSTGTPALFMHAADAIHGDLGMIQKEDFVLCISKSGNTPEVKVLVPMLKRMGSRLVALVSNTDSYLAEHADFVLNATIAAEACPLNLAPTTSTTAHMAMGDALAVCLLEARGFSSDDFARYHPGGALGKQLYLTVDDLMVKDAVPVVHESAALTEVILEISGKRLGATAVVDSSRKLMGIVTDGDLRRMLENHQDLSKLTAKDIMTINPKTIVRNEYAVRALNRMREYNITQLVVAEEGEVFGFIHIHDLMKEGIV